MDDNKKVEADKLQIRTNTSITEQFKELAKDFNNQGEALEAFLSSYKEQERKQKLPDQKADIDRLESNLHNIKNSFLHIIEAYNGAKEEAKTGYANQIEELTASSQDKDNKIKDLEEKIVDYKKQIDNLDKELKNKKTEVELINNYKSQNADLKTQVQSLQNTLKQTQRSLKNVEENLLEADKTNKDQNHKIWDLETDLKIKIADISNKDQSIKDLREQVADYKAQITDLRADIKNKDNYIAKLNKSLVEANTKAQVQNKSRDKGKN